MLHDPRLQRLAAALDILALIVMIGIPLAIVIKLLTGGLGHLALRDAFPDFLIRDDLSLVFRLTAVFAGLLPLIAGLATLDALRDLLRNYKQGRVIGEETSGIIRRIGNTLIAIAGLAFIARPVQSILLTWGNAEGQRTLSIGLEFETILLILAGGLMILIGWAMGEAARLQRENAGFI